MEHGDEKRMLVVLDCCIGCHACEIACRQEHDLTADTQAKWCRVMTVKPRKVQDGLHLDFFPVMCIHCETPLCMAVCPQEAIAKNADGLVLVDAEKCNGCRLCIGACPQGAMSFNEVTQTAGKCDFCRERVASGIEPSCVQHCIGGALRYLGSGELQEVIKGKHAACFGRTWYTSSKWKLSV